MDNFKTYYLANEGFASRVKAAAGAVGGGIKKGIKRAKKAVTSDKSMLRKVAGVADAGIEAAKDVGGGVGKEVVGAADEVTGGQVTGDRKLEDIDKIETYEDLRAVIDGIINQKRQGALQSAAVNTAKSSLGPVGMLSDLGDLTKAIAGIDDEVETQTGSVIDILRIDDQLATIVDDRIENNFLGHMQKKIETEKGPIPPGWDINKELKQFLSTKFAGRTVTGDQE